jgi:hypothetical protein
MAPPIHHRKPNLAHFQTRQIMCPGGGEASESTLKPQLIHWMAARWSPQTLGLALATKFRTYDLLVN